MKKLGSLAFAAFILGATTQANAISVGGWLGYNFATGVDTTTCEASKGASGECSKGGVALGADLWLLGLPGVPVKFGLGAAYIPVSFQKYTQTVGTGPNANSTYTLENRTSFVPVYAEVRADIVGFFAGAMVGYGISTSTASSSAAANSVTLTTEGSSFGIGAFAGYGIGLGPVSLEGGLRAINFTGSFNIMPFIGARFEI